MLRQRRYENDAECLHGDAQSDAELRDMQALHAQIEQMHRLFKQTQGYVWLNLEYFFVQCQAISRPA